MGELVKKEAGEPVVGGPDVKPPMEKALGERDVQTIDGDATAGPPLFSIYWSPPRRQS